MISTRSIPVANTLSGAGGTTGAFCQLTRLHDVSHRPVELTQANVLLILEIYLKKSNSFKNISSLPASLLRAGIFGGKIPYPDQGCTMNQIK